MPDPTAQCAPEIPCPACGARLATQNAFCPHCGTALVEGSTSSPKATTTSERRSVEQWHPALPRLLIVGALLLSIPDTLFVILFHQWTDLPLLHLIQFLALDAIIGLCAVLLIVVCEQRGIMGDFILTALRLGQMPLLYATALMPFRTQMMATLLFISFPLVALLMCGLVLRSHITDLMDAACNWKKN